MKTPIRAALVASRDKIRFGAARSARRGTSLSGVAGSQSGFTYLAALVMVIVLGISVSGVVQVWSIQKQRERETELLWILSQYRNAIFRWYNQPPGSAVNPPLRDLKHLVKDPNRPGNVRYLRRLYKDPFPDPATGKQRDLVPITDPTGRIIGVKSLCELEPIKKANFPDDLIELEGKVKYSEFEFDGSKPPPKRSSLGTVSGLKTTPVGGSLTPTQGYDPTGVPGWGAPATSPAPGVPGWGAGAPGGPASPSYAPGGEAEGTPPGAAEGQPPGEPPKP